MKQVMTNHIQMEEFDLLQYRPLCKNKYNQHKGLFKQNHSLSRNESSRKNYEGLTYENLVYPEDL